MQISLCLNYVTAIKHSNFISRFVAYRPNGVFPSDRKVYIQDGNETRGILELRSDMNGIQHKNYNCTENLPEKKKYLKNAGPLQF